MLDVTKLSNYISLALTNLEDIDIDNICAKFVFSICNINDYQCFIAKSNFFIYIYI